MNLLELLPLNETKLKVLLEIYSEEDYLRSIERKTKINPSLLFRILKNFSAAEVVERVKKGQEYYYSMTKESKELLVNLLEKYQLDRASKNESVKMLLKMMLNNPQLMACEKMLLYGPGVFGEGKEIDILFVTKGKPGVVKWCQDASLVVGKKIKPLIYSPEEYKLESKTESLKSILQLKNQVRVK